jgi:hypothetical protein
VLKLLQIMTNEGLVVRDKRDKIYSAKPTQKAADKRPIRDLVDKAFGGNRQRGSSRAKARGDPRAARPARGEGEVSALEVVLARPHLVAFGSSAPRAWGAARAGENHAQPSARGAGATTLEVVVASRRSSARGGRRAATHGRFPSDAGPICTITALMDQLPSWSS